MCVCLCVFLFEKIKGRRKHKTVLSIVGHTYSYPHYSSIVIVKKVALYFKSSILR